MFAAVLLMLCGAGGHRFACLDHNLGKAMIFSADGQIEWEHAAPAGDDLWVLPNGNVLLTMGTGVSEFTRQGQEVFTYRSKSEIYACQRLSDGMTFVGECNGGRLLCVKPDGGIAHEIRLLAEGVDGGHVFMRNARRLANGNYLVALYGSDAVREYDAEGKVVREIPAAGGPHSVVRLPNGNTLISCGDRPGGSRVFEVDASGTTVWQVKGDELPGISLKFMAGVHRLPNGNTVMCNWLGHGNLGKGPHLIEVTPAKEVVWTFADHKRVQTISCIQLLDVPGDVLKGEVLR